MGNQDLTDNTSDSNVRWQVWIYPWSLEPVFTDNSAGSTGAFGIAKNIGKPKSMSAGTSLPKREVTAGITFIGFNRGKGSNSSLLTFSIVGPVDDTLVIGNWVVVKSNAKLNTIVGKSEEKKSKTIKSIEKTSYLNVPRFVGQIEDINTSYNKNPETGKIGHVTSVTVKEWSHVYDVAVRYDESVVAAEAAQAGLPATISSTAAGQGQTVTQEEMFELMSQAYNPFEYAHMILKLVGGISKADSLTSKSDSNLKLPQLALRFPDIPDTLLQDLGLSEQSPLQDLKSLVGSAQPSANKGFDNAFTTGFATVITGVLKDALHNKGEWDGLYSEGEVRKMSKGTLYERDPPGRPITSGMTTLLSQGLSAWGLLNRSMDTDFNEIFTDMIYERTKAGNIKTYPVLWLRDKPFALKSVFKTSKRLSSSGVWTKYDDLPRIYLPSSHLQSVQFSSTAKKAVNFIKIDFVPNENNSDYKILSTLAGTIRNRPNEMARFGGREMFASTNFVTQEFFKAGSEDSPLASVSSSIAGLAGTSSGWFEQLRDILDVWWGQYFKQPSAVLSIKDYNVPFSIGHNITWIMGDIQLVGHIESANISVSINPETGKHSTDVILHLDRVCKTVGDPAVSGKKFGIEKISLSAKPGSSEVHELEFISPEKVNNMLVGLPTKKKVDKLSGLTGKLTKGIDKPKNDQGDGNPKSDGLDVIGEANGDIIA